MLGLGPVGLCAVQAAKAAGADHVIAVDLVEERLEVARSFGAEPIHLTEGDPRAAAKAPTDGRGVDVAIDAVGHPDALELACRMTRKAGTVSATGAYAERIDLHMGIVWIKALTLQDRPGERDRHLDTVLDRLVSGALDPVPARHPPHGPRPGARGLRVYDRHEALKIVLRP